MSFYKRICFANHVQHPQSVRYQQDPRITSSLQVLGIHGEKDIPYTSYNSELSPDAYGFERDGG